MAQLWFGILIGVVGTIVAFLAWKKFVAKGA